MERHQGRKNRAKCEKIHDSHEAISGGLADAVDDTQALGALRLTFIERLEHSRHPIVRMVTNGDRSS